MSIIVKGMNKPKNCKSCVFCLQCEPEGEKIYRCILNGWDCYNLNKIIPECPLKELDESALNPDLVKKPPLGLMPRELWEEFRIREILAAMKRYEKENMPIPQEWFKELRDLTANLVSK